ncbi:hypothetical protein pb186bvf_021161 [Paramecium bursaria]
MQNHWNLNTLSYLYKKFQTFFSMHKASLILIYKQYTVSPCKIISTRAFFSSPSVSSIYLCSQGNQSIANSPSPK